MTLLDLAKDVASEYGVRLSDDEARDLVLGLSVQFPPSVEQIKKQLRDHFEGKAVL